MKVDLAKFIGFLDIPYEFDFMVRYKDVLFNCVEPKERKESFWQWLATQVNCSVTEQWQGKDWDYYLSEYSGKTYRNTAGKPMKSFDFARKYVSAGRLSK